MQNKYIPANQSVEFKFTSDISYKDPFNEVELNALFTCPDGKKISIPGFWAGGNQWCIRFMPLSCGNYTFYTVCSDKNNKGLENQKGNFSVSGYSGNNELYIHGPVKLNKEKMIFEHTDGKPFFWLGDTWWMCLSKRLSFNDFQFLCADRKSKGFSVIQLVMGLYPDMPAFDVRANNEGGYCWENNFERINPSFFEVADIKIKFLVESGFVPCIFGSWGYYSKIMGIEKLKKHWRYIIARYSSYPVIWCLAGEGKMPYYLSDNPEEDKKLQISLLTEIAKYIREIDPFKHPLTLHPSAYSNGRDEILDEKLLDFDMTQSTHAGNRELSDAIKHVLKAVKRKPQMIVVSGEACYEGNLSTNWEDVQRTLFYSCFLSGISGYTYGADGIWQGQTEDELFGASPHGSCWGETSFKEAMNFKGSKQLGYAKLLFERFPWWNFKPHQEWISQSVGENNTFGNYCAGIPGEVRIIYIPIPYAPWSEPVFVKNLEPDIKYESYFFNPRNAKEYYLGEVKPDISGKWQVPKPPVIQDWVVVLKKK